jgi:hypothetical protein
MASSLFQNTYFGNSNASIPCLRTKAKAMPCSSIRNDFSLGDTLCPSTSEPDESNDA